MELFVRKNSIVREIWGNSDMILFIFAGAAAEFALNKAVDWLYFTGKLPSDPIGRLFSTVNYARLIVFSEKSKTFQVIDQMADIHKKVEEKRGMSIPEWAYRDVLFMLIGYSISSYELLHRKLTNEEKEEIFNVFNSVGRRMKIKGLPDTFPEWLVMRVKQMSANLAVSPYTKDLFKQYKKQLGIIRYHLLKEAQILVMPEKVKIMLKFRNRSLLSPVVPLYKIFSTINLDWILKNLLLPKKYKLQIKELDRPLQSY
ncbi:hypothetical protein BH23BAC1_BH23BAC1_49340 [soil metagenome]